MVLVAFTGSDWSPGSIKFKETILDTAEFNSYAQTNLELVEVDFPTNKPQADAVKFANTAWKQKYNVRIFPTLILINANGKEYGRHVGYTGNSATFVKELDGWKANASGVQDPDSGKWITDVPTAMARAKTANKLVLMDFTGSDWCVWCKKFNDETLSKADFIEYAKKNLVLVQLDYPRQKPQPDALKNANAALEQRYQISGFPTLIAMKADGTVVWRIDGYLEGGPQALIAQLEGAKQK